MRLRAIDDVINARAKRGDGTAIRPGDQWVEQPGAIPETPIARGDPMASEPRDPEREAGTASRLASGPETKALIESQRAECERDGERQNRALEDSRRQAGEPRNRQGERARRARQAMEAGQRPADAEAHPAPAFDMMGGPPARNLVQDHDEMRQRWTERRDQIVKDFDQRIASTEAARAEMQQGFGRANEARDQAHSEARRDLAQNQQQSFERLVKKELDRADKWTSREFNQRSRDDDARDL